MTIDELQSTLVALCPGSGFTLLSATYDGILWDAGQTFEKPSKEQIDSKLKETQAAEPMRLLREQRNALLAATDWRDLPSYAGTKQAEWRVYRQALRDITAGLDTVEKVKAATFPTQPS